MCSMVILFWVRVPVLSEQMQFVEPRVSTDSRFLTRTFFFESLTAATDSEIVIVARRPSGTLATMIPIANTRFWMKVYLTRNPARKKRTPSTSAMIVIILMNLFNSLLRGVNPASAVSAMPAICPMMVLSPMLKTIPFPCPFLQRVPKNATFFVSRIFFWVITDS